MRWFLLLSVALSLGCASTQAEHPSAAGETWEISGRQQCLDDKGADYVLAPICVPSGECALFRREDLVPGRIVRTYSSAPVFIAPGSGAQRTWGSAQGLPGDSLPVLRFRWHRREQLPSEVQRQRAMAEWAARPKERHHIFPQAFAEEFRVKGINVHDYVIAIDADVHARIHRGERGGPWNQEWSQFLRTVDPRAGKAAYFDKASQLIQQFRLFGLTMTYWQGIDLTPVPLPED
jgi:uncharacterized lipoprotein (TIGR02269 family)